MSELQAVLTEHERERVALLNINLDRKPAEDFLAGEYIKLEGTQHLGHGRWLKGGVYCVIQWRHDGLVLMRYGDRTKIDVPFAWNGGHHVREFTKVPLELVVLSERAKQRLEELS